MPQLVSIGDIADNLSKAGWSWGWVAAIDSEGRTIWIVDAHGYGKRFVVRSDKILTAFLELERATHEFAVSLISTENCGRMVLLPGKVLRKT